MDLVGNSTLSCKAERGLVQRARRYKVFGHSLNICFGTRPQRDRELVETEVLVDML